ncbi:SWIM zinc finger family protein [Petroclostridium sp. X23]|uniref:SWIM zinc finger family protein n=1 Tax=Petroclostridium sp. X23 TaxID=3045146 RepID=UPI0024ADB996|nr:SWIM zinc finger family protein [Petroclostridium sp. X23]WHH61649.1 hypothetical protein QKW49_08120 [Petroclostridium sp. X23]
MNLNNFESYIDRIIYLRGYDYYENGYVNFVKETEEHVYVAEVEGTETYTIDVELDDNLNIVETLCDCPFNMEEYCKHQVAVFLTLRDMKSNASVKKNSAANNTISIEPGAKHLAAKKNNEPDIEQILSTRSKEELIDFLLEIAAENEEVKQRILLEFDDGDDEEEILKAVSLIQTFIRNNSDRHGFVNYRDTYNAVNGAELVLDKADSVCDEGKTIHAVNLALCVVREMVDLIQNADDSSGTIGGVIERGFGVIVEIIENTELSSSEKNIVFENLMKEVSHRRYDGWTDWRLDFLEICSRLSDTPDLRNKLEKHMTLFGKNEDIDSWGGSYFAEKVNQIRYNMILHNDGEKKAQEFTEQNLHFSSFRKMTIERAMQSKDYEQVIKLALDGEAKDKGLPGLLDDWRKYRYKAYKLSGKLDKQRGLAMDFILDGSFEFYKELKSTYDLNDWIAVYPKIIFLLKNQKRIYSDIYTRILIEEGEKEKLLEYVKKSPSSVESYYKYLIPEFKEEVYDLFLKHIEQTASRAGNRRDYQGVCAIIRNLKKAGGKDQALEIKQKLFTKYANRPAFRDELTRV